MTIVFIKNHCKLDTNLLLPALFTRCFVYSVLSSIVPKSGLLSSSNPFVNSFLSKTILLELKCATEWSAVFFNFTRPTERVKSSDKYQITQIILHHSVIVMVCYKSETLTALSYFHYFCGHCYHIFDTRDIVNDSLQLGLYFWTTKCFERTWFQS